MENGLYLSSFCPTHRPKIPMQILSGCGVGRAQSKLNFRPKIKSDLDSMQVGSKWVIFRLILFTVFEVSFWFEILSNTFLILFIFYFHPTSLSFKIRKVYDEISNLWRLNVFSPFMRIWPKFTLSYL